MIDPSSTTLDREKQLNQLYIAVISRYKDYIGEKENLSVAELPTLVMPDSQGVKAKANEIKSGFLNYSYDSNFVEASLKASDFIQKDVSEVVLPVQFWLAPDETLTFMLGDTMDRNILLCSILIALGNPSARVLVKLMDSTRNVSVYYEFKGEIYVLGNGGTKKFKDREALMDSLGLSDDTVAYEFNNRMYADIS